MMDKLPIIGQVFRNRDERIAQRVLSNIPAAPLSVKGKKSIDILGGYLDIVNPALSNETTVSTALLKANKEWVYRNNDVIAMEVSKIEFELYQVGLKAGEIVFSEIQSHPLLDLLDKPNPETTKSDAVYVIQSHKKLTGDAFWLKIRNGRKVVALRSLPPDKVKLDLDSPTDKDPTVIKGFEYNDIINGEKVKEYYAPEDIIHIKKPNPNNLFRGLSAVEAFAETIDVDNLTNLTTKNFFKKGAITNFILSTESKVTQEQVTRLQAELKQMYGGAHNAYKTMVLGGGLKPEKLTFSNKEMEFLAQLMWYRDKIMVGFGNTPASLGIIEDVNRANAEATLASWKQNTIKPDMDSICNALNEFLVPEFGNNLLLGYVNPVPEDRTDDIEEATKLYSGGLIMLNEGRELLQYEAVKDGDTFRSPAPAIPEPGESEEKPDEEDPDKKSIFRSKNLRLAKRRENEVPRSLKHLDFKATLRSRGVYMRLSQNQQLKEAFMPIAKELIKKHKGKLTMEKALELAMKTKTEDDKYQPPKHTKFTSEEIMGYYKKQIHSVEIVESHLEKAIESFLVYVNDKIIDKLEATIEAEKGAKAQEKAYEKWNTKDVFDDHETEFLAQAQLDFTPLLNDLAVIAGQDAYKLVGFDDPYLPSKTLKKQISKNVNKFTQSMLETDRQHIINVISAGIENGQSVVEIRNTLSEDLEFTKMQSTRITRTEVLRASNQSAIDAWDQSGVVEGKQWITAGATDECADYEGQIQTLKGNFFDTSEFLDGDPPLHPNCRCAIIPIVVGSEERTFILDRDSLRGRIKELEDQVDKRTKAYKKLKAESADDKAYIKGLEGLLHESPEA